MALAMDPLLLGDRPNSSGPGWSRGGEGARAAAACRPPKPKKLLDFFERRLGLSSAIFPLVPAQTQAV